MISSLFARSLSIAALQNEEDAYRKIRLRVDDVQGRNCLTNFWVRDWAREGLG